MSFVKRQISLPNSGKITPGVFKMCSRCKRDRAPEGGIEMSPGRWFCVDCWVRRAQRVHS